MNPSTTEKSWKKEPTNKALAFRTRAWTSTRQCQSTFKTNLINWRATRRSPRNSTSQPTSITRNSWISMKHKISNECPGIWTAIPRTRRLLQPVIWCPMFYCPRRSRYPCPQSIIISEVGLKIHLADMVDISRQQGGRRVRLFTTRICLRERPMKVLHHHRDTKNRVQFQLRRSMTPCTAS